MVPFQQNKGALRGSILTTPFAPNKGGFASFYFDVATNPSLKGECCSNRNFKRPHYPNYAILLAMTPDLMHALTVSGGILLGVFLLIVIISIVAVNRGAQEMAQSPKQRDASRH
jgi:hypothetical protein